ncbi:MAG: hypothetical protein CME38_19655 [Haliea sp.]|nr:hypothetical protein [Haliea sp.]
MRQVTLVVMFCIMLALPLVPLQASSASPASPADIIAQRQEAIAYSVGLQAYFYGYPVVDYLRVMREQINQGLDPNGVYAPVNAFAYQEDLAAPGGLYAGRGPNSSTLYFTAWLDLSQGPVRVQTPDTGDRYYVLTWADLYSEVQHTGSRTTGSQAQTLWAVGPDWQGVVPEGVHLVRLRTHRGYLLGRVLVNGPQDLAAARDVMHAIELDGPSPDPAAYDLPAREALTSLAFFEHLNRFLRRNPRLPEEALLMAQMDQVGIGPSVDFQAEQLPAGLRRGLERAIADGQRILRDSPRAAPSHTGWSTPATETYGSYGFDYLRRAMVEYHGFLGNHAEETIYLSALTDASGEPLHGSQRYELVFPAGELPPAEAFWALNVYDARSVDLIPNTLNRYAISEHMEDLRYRDDGALVVRLQRDPPAEHDVNWLPVTDGPLFVTLRFFVPAPEVLRGDYAPPRLERLDSE